MPVSRLQARGRGGLCGDRGARNRRTRTGAVGQLQEAAGRSPLPGALRGSARGCGNEAQVESDPQGCSASSKVQPLSEAEISEEAVANDSEWRFRSLTVVAQNMNFAASWMNRGKFSCPVGIMPKRGSLKLVL